jgi:hypothetical protein
MKSVDLIRSFTGLTALKQIMRLRLHTWTCTQSPSLCTWTMYPIITTLYLNGFCPGPGFADGRYSVFWVVVSRAERRRGKCRRGWMEYCYFKYDDDDGIVTVNGAVFTMCGTVRHADFNCDTVHCTAKGSQGRTVCMHGQRVNRINLMRLDDQPRRRPQHVDGWMEHARSARYSRLGWGAPRYCRNEERRLSIGWRR